MSILKEIWNNTVFPEILERRRLKKDVRNEAIKEAIVESKDEMKEIFKQKQLDKIRNEESVVLKISKKLKDSDLGSKEHINRVLGNFSASDKSKKPMDDERVRRILGK